MQAEACLRLKVMCRSLARQCVSMSQQCTLAAKMANNILGQKHSQLSEQRDDSHVLSTCQTILKIFCTFLGSPDTRKSLINFRKQIRDYQDDLRYCPVKRGWRSKTQPGRETVFGRTQKQIPVSTRKTYQGSGGTEWCETGRCNTT